MELERQEKRTFECSYINVINDKVIQITISKEPKTPNCGSYFKDGKVSLPTVNMLLRHANTGTDFLVNSIDRRIPFDHKIGIQMKFMHHEMPKINIDDLFMGGGFTVNEHY